MQNVFYLYVGFSGYHRPGGDQWSHEDVHPEQFVFCEGPAGPGLQRGGGHGDHLGPERGVHPMEPEDPI